MLEQAFVDEILADPDNLDLRHVYADWLDQQGESARATLIRLQCGAEGLEGRQRTLLEKQARALIRANPSWLAPIKRIKLAKKPIVRRGFLHGITLPAYRFVEVAEELFRVAPMLRAVVFPLPLDEITALAACPQVKLLTSADLSQFCTCNSCGIDEQICEVFVHPSFANLVHLRTSGNRIDAESALVIAASTTLPNLRQLDLSSNHLGDEGAEAFLDAPWLDQLTRLDLRDNAISDALQQTLRRRFKRVVRL